MDNVDEIKAGEQAAASGENDSKEETAKPGLPEGIGLDYENMLKLLAVKTETADGADDSVMKMVAFGNAFLGEMEKLNQRHNETVNKIIDETSMKSIRRAFEVKASEPASKMPALPEGIGLGYEDVRKLLAMKHDIVFSIDDPMMMLVTLCNVFLGELEKLHHRHNDAVTKIMGDQSKKYIDGVKATTDSLSQTLADTSIEAIRKIFNAHATELNTNRLNSRWCAAIIAASALVNVAVLAFGFWR